MGTNANRLARLEPYQFKPGHPGGPGRPVGSRNRLTEDFLAKMQADFAEHGTEVIERVRNRKPEVYLLAVAALVPRKFERDDSPLVNITDEELAQLEQHLAAVRAKTVRALELHAEPAAGVSVAGGRRQQRSRPPAERQQDQRNAQTTAKATDE
jgi:hypothetical protein